MKHLYKSQLQIYAQKRNLELPVYSVDSVGPCHASKFKCGVIFQGKRFETKELFHTAKEAEYAAAKVALDSIAPVETKEEDPFIYKNLVQEILQKEHACLPKYTTIRTGQFRTDDTIPVFGACNSSRAVRTDAQPFPDKQNNCQGFQNLRPASSVPEPISYPKTPPPITVMNSQLMGPSSSDRMKTKRKMLVFPQSGSSSPEDVPPVIVKVDGYVVYTRRKKTNW